MTAIAYPAGLPAPASMSVVPRERRVQQDGAPQVGELRLLQTDDVSLVQASFTLTESQAEAWSMWYDVGLTFGGSWFSATWPLPQGLVAATWRVVGHPTWSLVDGAGVWRVSVAFEARVRALPPQTSGGSGPVTLFMQDTFTGTNGTDLLTHVGEVGAEWQAGSGPTEDSTTDGRGEMKLIDGSLYFYEIDAFRGRAAWSGELPDDGSDFYLEVELDFGPSRGFKNFILYTRDAGGNPVWRFGYEENSQFRGFYRITDSMGGSVFDFGYQLAPDEPETWTATWIYRMEVTEGRTQVQFFLNGNPTEGTPSPLVMGAPLNTPTEMGIWSNFDFGYLHRVEMGSL
jgi:hypothetical protein